MAIQSYVGTEIDVNTDAWDKLITKVNEIVTDMGSEVLSVGNNNVGDTSIKGAFSANTIYAGTELSGGYEGVSANLAISSNTTFTGNNTNFSATTDTIHSGNITLNGATKTFLVDNANTVIRANEFTVESDSVFTGTVQIENTLTVNSDIEITNTANINTANVNTANVNSIAVNDLTVSGNTEINGGNLVATADELNTLDGVDTSGTGFGFVPQGGIIMWSGSANNVPTGWYLCDGTNGTPNLQDRFIVGAGNNYNSGDTGGADNVTLTQAQLPSHTHSVSGTTDNDTHRHDIPGQIIQGNGDKQNVSVSAFVQAGGNLEKNCSTANETHNHSFSTTSGSAGVNQSHENRPPYYALAFIMKA